MKVISYQKATCHFVEMDTGEWRNYTRWGPKNWYITMGESDEPVYSEKLLDELEKAFQEAQPIETE